MGERHYGLSVGDEVFLNHPSFKDQLFEVIYCYATDNNLVRIRRKGYGEPEHIEFNYPAEWCRKVKYEKLNNWAKGDRGK